MALLLKASRVITPIVLCLRFTYKMLKLNKIEIKDKDFIAILKDFSLESYIFLQDFIAILKDFSLSLNNFLVILKDFYR